MSKRDASPVRDGDSLLLRQIQGKIAEYDTLRQRLHGKPFLSSLFLYKKQEHSIEYLVLKRNGIWNLKENLESSDFGQLGLALDFTQPPAALLATIRKLSLEFQEPALQTLKTSLDLATENILRVEMLLLEIQENWLNLDKLTSTVPASLTFLDRNTEWKLGGRSWTADFGLSRLQIDAQTTKDAPISASISSLHLINSVLDSLVTQSR